MPESARGFGPNLSPRAALSSASHCRPAGRVIDAHDAASVQAGVHAEMVKEAVASAKSKWAPLVPTEEKKAPFIVANHTHAPVLKQVNSELGWDGRQVDTVTYHCSGCGSGWTGERHMVESMLLLVNG